MTCPVLDLPEFVRAEYFDRQNVCQAVAPPVCNVDKKALLANARPLGDSLTGLSSPELKNPLSPESIVIARLNGRAKAWQDRNLQAYLAYYAEDFVPADGVTKAAWLKQRSERIKNAGRADVALRVDKVSVSGNEATAKVTELPVVAAEAAQNVKQYEVSKELQLKLVSNNWLIVSETVID